jgi:hypothetical protein
MKENDHGSGEGSRNLGEFPFAVSHHGCIVGPRCCFAARSSNRCCSSCRWRCCCAKGSTSHMLSVLARALPKAIQHHIQRQPRANLRPMNKFDPWLSAMKVLRPLGHLARSIQSSEVAPKFKSEFKSSFQQYGIGTDGDRQF